MSAEERKGKTEEQVEKSGVRRYKEVEIRYESMEGKDTGPRGMAENNKRNKDKQQVGITHELKNIESGLNHHKK